MEINFKLKLDSKPLVIIILIICTSVLIFNGKLKESNNKLILDSFLATIAKNFL